MGHWWIGVRGGRDDVDVSIVEELPAITRGVVVLHVDEVRARLGVGVAGRGAVHVGGAVAELPSYLEVSGWRGADVVEILAEGDRLAGGVVQGEDAAGVGQIGSGVEGGGIEGRH